jgi:hypothetical protein
MNSLREWLYLLEWLGRILSVVLINTGRDRTKHMMNTQTTVCHCSITAHSYYFVITLNGAFEFCICLEVRLKIAVKYLGTHVGLRYRLLIDCAPIYAMLYDVKAGFVLRISNSTSPVRGIWYMHPRLVGSFLTICWRRPCVSFHIIVAVSLSGHLLLSYSKAVLCLTLLHIFVFIDGAGYLVKHWQVSALATIPLPSVSHKVSIF